MSYKDDQAVRDALAQHLMQKVDEYYESKETRQSRRLGSSAIGNECSRETWYGFRHVKKPNFNGQTLRIFETGHVEEIRINTYLKAIGCTLSVPNPEKPTEQWEGSAIDDHGVTKTDGVILLPEECEVKEWVLLESKTSNESNFKKIKSKGIQRTKPEYWAQVCYSGEIMKLSYVLFVVANKNNCEIHIELLQLDKSYGRFLIEKATDIVNARRPPARVSQSSTYLTCKWCDYLDICHNGEEVERNCRSCVHSKPVAEGQWYCDKFTTVLDPEFMPKGCEEHEGLHIIQ